MSSAAGALLMPIAFLIGVEGGIQGMVHAWQVAAPVLLAITLALTLPRIGVRIGELLAALIPVIAATAVMAAVVATLDRFLGEMHPLPHLAALVAAGGSAYLGTLWLGWRDVVLETWAMLRNK
jgi:hypothetical protein